VKQCVMLFLSLSSLCSMSFAFEKQAALCRSCFSLKKKEEKLCSKMKNCVG